MCSGRSFAHLMRHGPDGLGYAQSTRSRTRVRGRADEEHAAHAAAHADGGRQRVRPAAGRAGQEEAPAGQQAVRQRLQVGREARQGAQRVRVALRPATQVLDTKVLDTRPWGRVLPCPCCVWPSMGRQVFLLGGRKACQGGQAGASCPALNGYASATERLSTSPERSRSVPVLKSY